MKEQVLAMSTDEQLKQIVDEVMDIAEENPYKIEMMKSAIRIMEQEKILAEIKRIQDETRFIRKQLAADALDTHVREGFFGELEDAGFSDEDIFKFMEVLTGW